MRVRRPTKSAALLVGSMHACLFACRTSQHVALAARVDLAPDEVWREEEEEERGKGKVVSSRHDSTASWFRW